jgi:glycosyltransferase 2 family protein
MKHDVPWLRSWRFWFGCILSLLCLWLAFRQTQFGALVQTVADANPLFLLAALAAQLLVVMSRARRWVVLLKEDDRFVDSFWAHSVGFLFTNIFPLRLGEPVRVLLMAQRCQLPVAQVAASAIGERLLDVVSTVLVLLVVLPWVQVPDLVRQAALSFSVVGFVGMSMLLLVVRYESLSEKVLRVLCSRFSFLSTKKVEERWRELVRGFQSLTQWRTASQAVYWSLIPWAFAIAVSWSVLMAFQPAARFVEAAFMVVALSFAVAVPSSPGFVGVFQLVGQQALMLPFGAKYDATSALAITLTAHLTYYIPTTLLGVVGLWRLGESVMTLRTYFHPGKGE